MSFLFIHMLLGESGSNINNISMTTVEFCILNKDGKPTNISEILKPYTFYKDKEKEFHRYILNPKEGDFILDITIEDCNDCIDVQIQKYDRDENREEYTDLFCHVVCEDFADRKRYEEVNSNTIYDTWLYEMAKEINTLTQK